MRKAERLPDQNLLEINKYNIVKNWRVLKDIIGKKKNPSNCDTFIISKNTTSDKQKFAYRFNNYFVNVGPDLANKIEVDTIGKSAIGASCIDKRNTSFIFITPTSNDEI